MFRNVRGKGRVKTKAYDDWRAAALTHVRLQKVLPVAGRVLVLIGVERDHAGADIDNRAKALFDVLVKAGIIDDDNLVTAFAIAWLPPANGLAHLTVTAVHPVTLQFQPSKDRATGGWYFRAPTHDGEPNGPVD